MVKRALLIGVSHCYSEDDPLPREQRMPMLTATSKDVEAMMRVLRNPDLGAFNSVKPLLDPDLMTMQKEIYNLFQNCKSGDLGLLYFSGHGIKSNDVNEHLYLSTHTTSKDSIKATSVPARFISDIMNEHKTNRQQVLILDCCYSGAFSGFWQSKGGSLNTISETKLEEAIVIMASCSSIEESFQDKEGEMSVYTKYIVQAIESGEAKQDINGFISANDLHEYAKVHVQRYKKGMTPEANIFKHGSSILLSKARVDAKVLYRRLVEKYAENGEITGIGRNILDGQQKTWGLSKEDAIKIENEVLEPDRQRLRNIEKYIKALESEIKKQYPMTNRVRELLDDLLHHLKLREEDISERQEQVIAPYAAKEAELERSRQLEIEKQRNVGSKKQKELEKEKQRRDELEQKRQREATQKTKKIQQELAEKRQRQEVTEQKRIQKRKAIQARNAFIQNLPWESLFLISIFHFIPSFALGAHVVPGYEFAFTFAVGIALAGNVVWALSGIENIALITTRFGVSLLGAGLNGWSSALSLFIFLYFGWLLRCYFTGKSIDYNLFPWTWIWNLSWTWGVLRSLARSEAEAAGLLVLWAWAVFWIWIGKKAEEKLEVYFNRGHIFLILAFDSTASVAIGGLLGWLLRNVKP